MMGNSTSTYIHAHFLHKRNSLLLISISMTKEDFDEDKLWEELRRIVAKPSDWTLDEIIDPSEIAYRKKIAKYF